MPYFKNIKYIFEYRPEVQEVEDIIVNIYAINPECVLLVQPGMDDDPIIDDTDPTYLLDQSAAFHLYVDIATSDEAKIQAIERSVREIVEPYLHASI